jgi:hypothetical protein
MAANGTLPDAAEPVESAGRFAAAAMDELEQSLTRAAGCRFRV